MDTPKAITLLFFKEETIMNATVHNIAAAITANLAAVSIRASESERESERSERRERRERS